MSQFKFADGSHIGYRILAPDGNSPANRTLVIINGMSMRLEDWDDISLALSRKRKVVLFDHRGIGASITPTFDVRSLSVSSMAEDVISLLGHLELRDVDLMGFSMGGAVCNTLMSLKPAKVELGMILQTLLVRETLPFRVHSVILASTSAKAPHGDPEFVEAVTQRPPEIVNARGPLTDEQKMQLARPMLEMAYDTEWLASPNNQKRIHSQLPSQIINRPSKTIMYQALAARSFDVRKELHQIPPSVRVLVIHGRKDKIIHYSESEYILNGIKHSNRPSLVDTNALGSLPSDQFGHNWYDYFDLATWVKLLEDFLDLDQQQNAKHTESSRL